MTGCCSRKAVAARSTFRESPMCSGWRLCWCPSHTFGRSSHHNCKHPCKTCLVVQSYLAKSGTDLSSDVCLSHMPQALTPKYTPDQQWQRQSVIQRSKGSYAKAESAEAVTSAPPPRLWILEGSCQKKERLKTWQLGFIEEVCLSAMSSACVAACGTSRPALPLQAPPAGHHISWSTVSTSARLCHRLLEGDAADKLLHCRCGGLHLHT